MRAYITKQITTKSNRKSQKLTYLNPFVIAPLHRSIALLIAFDCVYIEIDFVAYRLE